MNHQIDASEWINTDHPWSLTSLRGKVVMVCVFQMLCPGCVQRSLPQARKVDTTLGGDDLVVIGLHSVFEHHEVMTPAALRAFAHQNQLRFPIAVDRPREGPVVPSTMHTWGLEGTPTLMVFGRDGELALRHFGHLDDLNLGMVLGQLLARSP